MSNVTLIIAYVMIMEFVAIRLNRTIIKNAHVNANLETFHVRYTGFSIFFSLIMCASLAAFTSFFMTESGSVDSNSITSIIFLLIGLFDLTRQLFFKIEVAQHSIVFRSLTRRAHFTFDEIKNVTIAKAFQHIQAHVFSNDDKMFILKNEMSGYHLFIERLKKENVEWQNVSGKPLNKSDI